MPLKPGKKNIGSNIKEIMDSFKEKGRIGNITPKNHEHALRIAKAIAEREAKKNKGKL